MRRGRRAFLGIAMLLAGCTTLALAQDGEVPAGHWTGLVEEPGGDPDRYTVSIHFGRDHGGRPLASVEYDAFPCAGVWTDAAAIPSGWRFAESITDDPGERCAPHGRVELRREGADLEMRWWQIGDSAPSARGRLRRR